MPTTMQGGRCEVNRVYSGVAFVCNEEIPDEEAEAYVSRGIEVCKGRTLKKVEVEIDGEHAEVRYYSKENFDRIRRITGYLVGTTDRFNDAKASEERDRVKHGV